MDLNDLMLENALLEAYLYRTDQPGAPYRHVRLWPEGISLSANQEGQETSTSP